MAVAFKGREAIPNRGEIGMLQRFHRSQSIRDGVHKKLADQVKDLFVDEWPGDRVLSKPFNKNIRKNQLPHQLS